MTIAPLSPVRPLAPARPASPTDPAIEKSAAYRAGYSSPLPYPRCAEPPAGYSTVERVDYTIGMFDAMADRQRGVAPRIARDRAAQRGEVGAWA